MGRAVDVADLRAAYDFLQAAAFYDIPLPKRISFARKRYRVVWGYFCWTPTSKQISIAKDIVTGDKLLKVMAHEMIHAALHHAKAHDPEKNGHGKNFHTVARVVCRRMGWPTRKGL